MHEKLCLMRTHAVRNVALERELDSFLTLNSRIIAKRTCRKFFQFKKKRNFALGEHGDDCLCYFVSGR